jgi:pyruvate formate lyase activating enzyme
MRLGGYMKLTLQDYPGSVAAICFTNACQLRCPYCHNAELVLSNVQRDNKAEEKTSHEFLYYLEQRRFQLDGVVISGGEPLLQHDIQDFLHKIKSLGLKIKLDTNGLLPEKLGELISHGLVDYVALDYKNCREHFAETVGLSNFEDQEIIDDCLNNWKTSLNCLRKNKIPYELRTTVVRELHPLYALIGMAESIRMKAARQEPWFLQSFFRKGQLMYNYTNQDITLSAYSIEEMEEIKQELKKIIPYIQLRG